MDGPAGHAGPDADGEALRRLSIASSADADGRLAGRSSIASSCADETPRDRLMVLLAAVINGEHVDAALAREVREAVVTNALFVPHAVQASLHEGGALAARAGGAPGVLPADADADVDAGVFTGPARARSLDMLQDPWLRETVAPVASLTPATERAEARPPAARPGAVNLGRSDTLSRDGAVPVLLRSFSRTSEPPGAGQETLPVELQLRQMLHELPPHERHTLQPLPPHVQAAVLAAGASGLDTLPRLLDLLERVPFYDFDAFDFNEAAGGAPLSALFALLVVKLGLAQSFNIDLRVLARFTRAVEARMPPNGYHNAAHIADVLHSVAILLTGGLQDLVGLHDDSLCVAALLMAAAVHDFEHPGLTGDHLVATGHPWALLHNDRAVLEQHHLSAAFQLLSTPGLDWTAGFSAAQRSAFRATVIDLVLGTDMKEHFKLLGEFGNVLHRARLAASARRRRRRSSTAGDLQGGEPAPMVQATLSDAERLLVLKIAMKVADLGHLRAPRDVHLRWVAGLCHEFYQQGDREQSLGMTVNDLMSRERAAAAPGALAESQVGFFDVIALPLVQQWAKATGARRWLERVNRNYEFWRSQRDAHSGVEAFVAATVRIAGLPAQLTIPEGSETLSSSGRPHSSSLASGKRRSGDGRERRHSLASMPTRSTPPPPRGMSTEELTTSGTDGEARGAEAGPAGAHECFEEAAAGILPTEPLLRRTSSESSGAMRRHALRGSSASSPAPSGSGGSDCTGGTVCAWCGLPPVPGARRLSRESRIAAATAAAAAAAAAAPLLGEADSEGEGRRVRGSGVRNRRARFSETDACRGLRATRVQFEEFRHSRSGEAAVAAVVAAVLAPARSDPALADTSAAAHALADLALDSEGGACRPRRSSAALDPSLPSALGRHRVSAALCDSAADASPPPSDRMARRSTGSVTFEAETFDAEGDAAEQASQQSCRFGVAASEASSWAESEECFGQLVISRSLGSA